MQKGVHAYACRIPLIVRSAITSYNFTSYVFDLSDTVLLVVVRRLTYGTFLCKLDTVIFVKSGLLQVISGLFRISPSIEVFNL
jgi:hypothetical protein